MIQSDDYIGKQYGCYIMIDSERDENGKLYYIGKCIHCGTIVKQKLEHFKERKTDNCTHYYTIGNKRIKIIRWCNNRLRKIFYSMVSRCYDNRTRDYRWYGKKGIRVYQPWLDNPQLFIDWALLNNYNDKMTIDRINENQDYSPLNCRWVDSLTNSRFKSNTNYITATVTLSGRQWSDVLNVGVNRINRMVRENGYDETVAFIENSLSDKRNTKINSE